MVFLFNTYFGGGCVVGGCLGDWSELDDASAFLASHASTPTELQTDKPCLPHAEVDMGQDARSSISSFLCAAFVLAKQNCSCREHGSWGVLLCRDHTAGKQLQRETAFISVEGWDIPLGRGKALMAHHTAGLAASMLGDAWTSSFSKLSFQACIRCRLWAEETSWAIGQHPATEICRELKVWGGRVWDPSSGVDPGTRQIDSYVQGEQEPAKKVADSICFSDKYLLMKGCLYWLCSEATKPSQLNRLKEPPSEFSTDVISQLVMSS